MKQKKSPSWIAVILWFVFFWPVGIYFLWKKLSTDKAAALRNSKVLKGIGIFFLVAAVLMFFSAFGASEDTGNMIGGALFYLGGGLLIMLGAKKVKESGERYKKYIDIVINQQQHTIENIAAQTGIGYDKTVKELQEMIDKGYFSNAFIDHGLHEIVFPEKQPVAQTNNYVNQETQPTPKVVKCPNCGGNNTVMAGQVCECDFCGSAIKGE